MRKSFITGLVILLPLALTVIILVFVFNLLTDPFAGFLKGIFERYDLFGEGLFFLTGPQLRQIMSQILVLIAFFFFTVLLGIITRLFFFKTVFQIWDAVLHRIPIVRPIYKTCKEVIHTIFTDTSQSFKQVVLVPFPNRDTMGIGLVTRENLPNFKQPGGGALTAVFVPTTPNPTSGFLMMFAPKDLIYLDMPVEEAFKYIISCGVIATPFKEITPAEAMKLIEERAEEQRGDEV